MGAGGGQAPPAGWLRLAEWCRRHGGGLTAAYRAIQSGRIQVGRDVVWAAPAGGRAGWYVRPDLPWPSRQRAGAGQAARSAPGARRGQGAGESGFTRWLLEQVHRPGPVGEVARFVAADPCWPRRARTLAGLEEHLVATHRAPAHLLAALRAAWQEWRAVRG